MFVGKVYGGEGVSSYCTGEGSYMIVTPRSTTEGWRCEVWWMAKDINCKFVMLATKFGDEIEVPCTIKIPLHLMNDLM